MVWAMSEGQASDSTQDGITPAAPAAAQASDSPSRGFSQWMDSLTPAAPAAAPAQESAGVALPDIDPETHAHIEARDRLVRRDLDVALRGMSASQGEANARSEMWSTFQTRYPEFQGSDDFISSSFSSVTGGTMAVPPSIDLRDELMSRVYDHAVSQRAGLMKSGGYELVDGDETNRTAGVTGGTEAGPPAGRPSAPTKDESTLASELVMLQGETEFFPEMSEEDVLASYGKHSAIPR